MKRFFLFCIGMLAMPGMNAAASDTQTGFRPESVFIEYDADNGCEPGWVDMLVQLRPDSSIASAYVVSSFPEERFDDLALRRVTGSRIERLPGNDKPTGVVRVVFRLTPFQLGRCRAATQSA